MSRSWAAPRLNKVWQCLHHLAYAASTHRVPHDHVGHLGASGELPPVSVPIAFRLSPCHRNGAWRWVVYMPGLLSRRTASPLFRLIEPPPPPALGVTLSTEPRPSGRNRPPTASRCHSPSHRLLPRTRQVIRWRSSVRSGLVPPRKAVKTYRSRHSGTPCRSRSTPAHRW
jgi:hypothetical protein